MKMKSKRKRESNRKSLKSQKEKQILKGDTIYSEMRLENGGDTRDKPSLHGKTNSNRNENDEEYSRSGEIECSGRGRVEESDSRSILSEIKKKNLKLKKNMKKIIKQITNYLILKSTLQIDNDEPKLSRKKNNCEKTKIFVFNWNMHAKSGPRNLEEFEIWDSKVKQQKFAQNELVIFTCQESCHTIPWSFLFNSKKKWRSKLDKFLRKLGFVNVCDESLNALSSIIYIRKDQLSRLKRKVKTSKVKLGFGGVLANKGAIINTFEFKDMKMASINVHLPHGINSRDTRNVAISKILKKLFYQIKRKKCSCLWPSRSKTDVISYLDFVSFSGDFNFTFHMSKSQFIEILQNGNLNIENFEKLLQFDEYQPGTMKLSQVNKKSLLLKNLPQMSEMITNGQASFEVGGLAWEQNAWPPQQNQTLPVEVDELESGNLEGKQSGSGRHICDSESGNYGVNMPVRETIRPITLVQLLRSNKPKISIDKRQLELSNLQMHIGRMSSLKRKSLNIVCKRPKQSPGDCQKNCKSRDYYQTEPIPKGFKPDLESLRKKEGQRRDPSGENETDTFGAQSVLKCSRKTVKKTVFGKENCNDMSNVTQKLNSHLSNFYLEESTSNKREMKENRKEMSVLNRERPMTPSKAFTHIVDNNLLVWKTRDNPNLFGKIDLNRLKPKDMSQNDLEVGFEEYGRGKSERIGRKTQENCGFNKRETKSETQIEAEKRKLDENKITSKKLKKKLQKVKKNKLFQQEYEILEGKKNFPPTYKFFAGTSIYYLCNQRLPGYPDRIFYILKKNGSVRVVNLEYKSCFDIQISDHKPIYAVFELQNNKIKIPSQNNKFKY